MGFTTNVLKFDSQLFPLDSHSEKGIIWGPYNADLSRKGKYEVKFVITGKGFNENASHDIKESVFLRLDVCRWVSMGQKNGSAQDIFSNKYLKYKDFLGSNERKEFSMYLYSEGTGIWEYRAYLTDSITDFIQLLRKDNEKFSIYFEKIEVIYHPEIRLPW